MGIEASQQMRAAPGDPRRGANPVELDSSQPFGDFPISAVKAADMKAGVSGTNRRYLLTSASNEPSGRACTDIWRLPREPAAMLLACGG